MTYEDHNPHPLASEIGRLRRSLAAAKDPATVGRIKKRLGELLQAKKKMNEEYGTFGDIMEIEDDFADQAMMEDGYTYKGMPEDEY